MLSDVIQTAKYGAACHKKRILDFAGVLVTHLNLHQIFSFI